MASSTLHLYVHFNCIVLFYFDKQIVYTTITTRSFNINYKAVAGQIGFLGRGGGGGGQASNSVVVVESIQLRAKSKRVWGKIPEIF